MTLAPQHKLPPPPEAPPPTQTRDTLLSPSPFPSMTTSMYAAALRNPRPSPIPGIIKVALVAAVLAWVASLAANVAQVHYCSANGGTYTNGKCVPPVVEVKQYHITIEPPDGSETKEQAVEPGPLL